MAGLNGAQKIMEHIHLQPGNWSCWGLTVWFMVPLTESGFLIVIETGSWDGLGAGELYLRAIGAGEWQWGTRGGTHGQPEAVQTASEHPLSHLELLGRQQAQDALLRPRGTNGTRKDKALEGLKPKLMFLKFWSIKVILHSATEAMGQWKQITVHSPNRKIKTQEAAECCRHWPWLHNLANLCCLWGCTAVSEKTNLLVQKLLFYIIFLSFLFFFPDTSLCF